MISYLSNPLKLLRILWVLARHDALFFLEGRRIYPLVRPLIRTRRDQSDSARGKRLAEALEKLGPVFIKLGQALATRTDLMGEVMAEELATLQDKVAPFDGKLALHMIEAEFDRPLETLFSEFEPQAVAAASIAQVHFATTTEGKEVAVKVLRPDIAARFAKDVALLQWLAAVAERWMPSLRRLKPKQVVAKIAETIRFELDLRMEAAAASQMRENLANDKGFYIPEIDWSRTTEKVLTMERVSGIPAGRLQELKAAGHSPEAIVKTAAETFFQMVFRDGFFHADLHSGNLFIREGSEIAAVDFGIVGRVRPESRRHLARILFSFLKGDYHGVAQAYVDVGMLPAHHSPEAFALACRAIGEPIIGQPLKQISVAKLLAHLFKVAREFDIETQPDLLLLQKTMMTAEGLSRKLAPETNMWQLTEPLMQSWAAEHLSPKARAKQAAETTLEHLRQIPAALTRLEQAIHRLADTKD